MNALEIKGLSPGFFGFSIAERVHYGAYWGKWGRKEYDD